jgi:hypothetical protein
MTTLVLEDSPAMIRVFEHAVTGELESMLDDLGGVDGDPEAVGVMHDYHRVQHLALLERIKAAAAAAQARITVAFEKSQLVQQDDAGVRPDQRGRGIADQVVLARNLPASQGNRYLGFAKAMTEMPHTMDLLTRGRVDEWTATVLVRETAILTLEDRALVDERLCATTVDRATGEVREPRVTGLTPRRVEQAARAMASELDPASAVRRAARATSDRRVTIRPAPDTMTYLTGLLPVAQGVAVWANLKQSAAAAKAAGDERTESQLMADLFVERLTGQASADAVPVEIQLVMTPDTLVGASERPARIGEQVLPAQTARDLALNPGTARWFRRIFSDPATGTVVGRDPRRRRFDPAEARFLDVRDQTCRHPGCDRAIADRDHVQRVADGGITTVDNGQGLCEAHNLVKELPGWRAKVVRDSRSTHTVRISTPTGHNYRSHAPPVLPLSAR